jgi:capsular polysaccharide biosynthesis protein
MNSKIKKMWALTSVLSLCIVEIVNAQSGVTGLNTATSSLKTYVAPVTNITLVIGGIVGIVGAIRVYSKWNSGDQDINKELMGWGGSCVFLVVSAVVIKAFFGLS